MQALLNLVTVSLRKSAPGAFYVEGDCNEKLRITGGYKGIIEVRTFEYSNAEFRMSYFTVRLFSVLN